MKSPAASPPPTVILGLDPRTQPRAVGRETTTLPTRPPRRTHPPTSQFPLQSPFSKGKKPATLLPKSQDCTLMNIDAIAVGNNPPEELNVIIEVPLGGEPIKYEIDKDSGALFVDRFLYTPMRYPGNYGFVPHTLCGDGDPLDVIVLNSRPLVPGAVVRSRPVGVLFMEDDGGQDEKILAVPVSKLTRMYDAIKDVTDLPEIQVERVKHFFTHYKDLEPGKWAKIDRIGKVSIGCASR